MKTVLHPLCLTLAGLLLTATAAVSLNKAPYASCTVNLDTLNVTCTGV